MDDTKKALLSIELDTAALTQNATTAKAAIKDLTGQLNALQTAGQTTGPVFNTLSTQLKTTTTDFINSTKALKDYTDALGKKTVAEQADNKAVADKGKDNDLTSSISIDQSKIPAPNIPPATVSAIQKLPDVNVVPNSDQQKKAKKEAEDAEKEKAKAAATAANNKKKSADADAKLIEEGQFLLKNNLTAELAIIQTRDKAYATSAEKLASVFSKNLLANKAAVLAKKAFAIAELAINTEQQVSSYISATATAVSNDYKAGPIIGTALAAIDIAGGIAQVAATVANGVKQTANINSIAVKDVAGMATGGLFKSDGLGTYLTGPGTGTSDSINAMLSNGESVINARSTQMFAPILSAINQAGGGRAFHTAGGNNYATGGLFNGSNTLNDGSTDLAQTRAMNDMVRTIATNMPRQVLVVEDVQASLQNKVMLQNMSNF